MYNFISIFSYTEIVEVEMKEYVERNGCEGLNMNRTTRTKRERGGQV